MRPRRTSYNDPVRCENCRYFLQHYVLWGKPDSGDYRACCCGHCTQANVKMAKPYFVCDAFAEKK